MSIKWIGESDYWTAPVCQDNPQFVMAISEDWVLDVATMRSSARKLSLRAGLSCTSRLAMRVALGSTSLNPKWSPLEWNGACVAKAPASAANLGVRFLNHNKYVQFLQDVAPDLARFGVLEEYIDGPQFEVDGYAVGGKVTCFRPLLQCWNPTGDLILGYERKNPHGDWLEAVLTAVEMIGLNDTPFCVEMRYHVPCKQWKIIEVHARLGEDPGLAELMWDEYPIAVIERACRSVVD
jgi:hypothetical protein